MSEFITSHLNDPFYIQPDARFPREDISEKSISFLATVLSDPESNMRAHEAAEKSSRVFTMAHAVLSRIHLHSHRFSEAENRWLSIGASQYEAVSSLARGDSTNTQYDTLAVPQAFRQYVETEDFGENVTQTYIDFMGYMPNVTELITYVMTKQLEAPRASVELSLYGAALQYENELAAIATQAAVDEANILEAPSEFSPSMDEFERMINDIESL